MEKTLLRNFLLLIFVLFICLFFGELVLRHTVQPYYGFPPGAFIMNNQTLESNMTIKNVIGEYSLDYKPKPGFSGVFINEERQDKYVNVRINSNGFRDHEYAVEKLNDVKRIILIGDSVVMAEQVPLEETFAKIVEHDLGAKYQILNLGVSGYGTMDAFQFYKDVGEKYHPDMVIYFFTPNDLNDNFAKRYTIIDGERVSYESKDLPGWFVRIKIYLYRKSALLRTLYRAIKFDGNVNYDSVDLYAYYGGDKAWAGMEKIINEMKDYFKQEKVKFVVVRNPDPLSVYYNRDFGENQKLTSLGVELWNPKNLFVAHNNTELFYKIDKHMNKNGHELMAQFLYDKIKVVV